MRTLYTSFGKSIYCHAARRVWNLVAHFAINIYFVWFAAERVNDL